MRLITRGRPAKRGRRRQTWRRLVLGLVLAQGCGAGAVQACLVNRGGTTPNNNYYMPYDGALFQIAVPPGRSSFPLPAYPVAGEVLFVAERLLPALGEGSAQGRASPLYDCKTGGIEEFRGGTSLLPGHQNLYGTSVPGIGYRVYYYYIDASQHEAAPVVFENTHKAGALVFPFNGSPQLGSDLKARIEFVATGDPISPGQLLPAKIFGQSIVSNVGGAAVTLPYRVYLATPVDITPPTCDIQNPRALAVALPSVPAHLLEQDSGRSITTTTLDVACSSPSELSPAITITPHQALGGFPATLGNQETGATAATGVGVQLWLYDPATATYRHPAFGVTEHGIGAPVETLPSRRWQFRIGASYLPVGNPVIAGKVRASAVLQFTYL